MDIGTNKLIGSHLKEQRLRAGLKQTDVAERLSVPQSTISKLESGERSLRLYELFTYADILGLSPNELFATTRHCLIKAQRDASQQE